MNPDTQSLEPFARTAAEFCAWCEQGENAEHEERAAARTALRLLARLYALALDLKLHPGANLDLEGERSDDTTWKAVFDRTSALPLGLYSEVFDPQEVPSEAPVVGCLGDDLADIHRDLTGGLSLFRAGHVKEAEWEWCFHFQTHWGRHAASAIRTLHCCISDRDEW